MVSYRKLVRAHVGRDIDAEGHSVTEAIGMQSQFIRICKNAHA